MKNPLMPKVRPEVQAQFIKHCSTAKKQATWSNLSGKVKIATTTEECYQLFLTVVGMYRSYKLKDQKLPKQASVMQQRPGAKPVTKKNTSLPEPVTMNTRMFERLFNLTPESVALVMKDIIAKTINTEKELESLIEKIKNELFLINILVDHIRFNELFTEEYRDVLSYKDISENHILGRFTKPVRIETLARSYCTGANWTEKKYSYKQPAKDGQRNQNRSYKDCWENEKSFPPSVKEWLLQVKKARATLLSQDQNPLNAALSEAASATSNDIIAIEQCKVGTWTTLWDPTSMKTTCHPMVADLGTINGSKVLKEIYGSADISPHKRVVAFHMDLPNYFTVDQFEQTLSVVTHLATESFSCLIWGSQEQLRFVWNICERQFPEEDKLKIQNVVWLYAHEVTGKYTYCFLMHALKNSSTYVREKSI